MNISNKKYKLHKNRNRVIALGLGATLLFAYSNIKENREKTNTLIDTPTYTDVGEASTNYTDIFVAQGEDDVIEQKIESTDVYITQSQYNEFVNQLNLIDDEYEYSGLYNMNYSLQQYNLDKTETFSSSELFDVGGNLDVNKLYNKVIENNKQYLLIGNIKKHFYAEMESQELRDICVLVCEVMNTYGKNFSSSFATVCHNLEKLKIYYNNTSASNAYVNTEMCLLVNPNMMKIFHDLIHSDLDSNRDVMVHEVMHLLQYVSFNHNENDGFEVGICKMHNEDDVNALFWEWFIEASAEKNMCLYTGDRPTTYQYQIGYLESLSLCNILNDDFNVSDTERLCFQNDINKLYEIFGATSQREKDEILNLMYTIEIIESEPQPFMEKYCSTYGVELSDKDTISVFKQKIKSEVFTTLSKYFYKNLASKIYDGYATLEDVFYLINVWEADVHSHIQYTKELYMKDSKEFFDNYNMIQSEMFSILASNMNCSLEDIYNKYDNYSMRVKEGETEKNPNCDLSFLSSEKKSYINERKEAVYKKGIPSIKSVSAILEGITK